MGRIWALALACLAAVVGPAGAQPQQQRDPFNGQFGVMELAFPPREALRQVELLTQSLSALQPQRPGVVDVYVLSAAFWGDPVFEREAAQAEEILRQHFAADGRSIVMTAGNGLLERRYPASTPNNFNAALAKLGSLIDPDEDLVVVFLTTHGSPDGSAAMQEANRMGGALRPVNLRDSLLMAGIKNRVVIVSACFSGAFIAPLMNDDTIVLTAAAPDRTSFGCQPSRDWTFFGDAYFNHAIRGGASLVPAFDQAKVLIEQWEREQRLTPPSNPQRSVGPRAAALVTQAERNARAH